MNYERPSYLTFSYFINEVLADSIIYMDNDQLLPDYNVQIGVVAEQIAEERYVLVARVLTGESQKVQLYLME